MAIDNTAVVAQLEQLTDRATSLSDQLKLEESITGSGIDIELTVDRVRSTLGLGAPTHLKGGHTVIGKFQDLTFSARFPAEQSQTIQALKSGDTVRVRGIVAEWERLYRQAVVDVE